MANQGTKPREGVQLRSYQCHKVVHAAKILETDRMRDCPATMRLTLDVEGHNQLSVPMEWAEKHEPQVGGYFVAYEGGYESYSPAQPFEAGYSLLPKIDKCHGCFERLEADADHDRFTVPAGTLPSGGGERLESDLHLVFCIACGGKVRVNTSYFCRQLGCEEGVESMNRFVLQQVVDGKQVFEGEESGMVSYVKDQTVEQRTAERAAERLLRYETTGEIKTPRNPT